MGHKRRGTDPFAFIGHGFGTSARCLECYAWFVRPPGKADLTWIKQQLPFPVTSFARSTGALLHFGSDDDLEARVVAAYHPDFADGEPAGALEEADGRDPAPREWKADERSSRANDAWSALARNLREELTHVAAPARVASAPASDGLTAAQRRARTEGKALVRAALLDACSSEQVHDHLRALAMDPAPSLDLLAHRVSHETQRPRGPRAVAAGCAGG